MIIVSVAIIDVSNFVLEGYVLHSRQLRSLPEARQSLTKLITIIIIAFALEALARAPSGIRGAPEPDRSAVSASEQQGY
jgi:hypothetical protein